MTEYHFLALSSTTEYQFLQLRFMSCYLLNEVRVWLTLALSFVSHTQSFWALQSPFGVAAGQGGLQISLQPQVHQGGPANLASAQSGIPLSRRALMGLPFPLLCVASGNAVVLCSKVYGLFFHPLKNVHE